MNRTRGFTLIELLVVMAVIALLSSIILAVVSSSRVKARDTQRVANARQIGLALEQYELAHGTYRVAGAGVLGEVGTGYVFKDASTPGYQEAIARVLQSESYYASDSISDPVFGSENYFLGQCASSSGYALFLKVEQESMKHDAALIASVCGGEFAISEGFNHVAFVGGEGHGSSGSSPVAFSVPQSWTYAENAQVVGLGSTFGVLAQSNGVLLSLYDDYPKSRFSISTNGGGTWTSPAEFDDMFYREACFANGTFLAMQSDSGVSTSTLHSAVSSDGVSWTFSTTTYPGGAWSVAYGNGVYVAVGSAGTHRVIVSTDGLHWVPYNTLASDVEWKDITFGDGKFVAVGYGWTASAVIATSVNGQSWTPSDSTNANWHQVEYGNGVFLATGSKGGVKVVRSPDGLHWTTAYAPIDDWYFFGALTYADGLFFAKKYAGINDRYIRGGENTSIYVSSDNGESWTKMTIPDDGTHAIFDLAYHDKRIIASTARGFVVSE